MTPPKAAELKTERLLNLVIALLYTRQPMSKARIRAAVPQYADAGDEAFDRMFERDKGDLRDLGIPLRTETIDALFEDETGYRIDRREYALPEVEFTPDELAVIGLASRSWSQASLAGPAAQALRKLEADGLPRDEAGVAGIEPLLHTTEPSFEPVRAAVLARHTLRFRYRSSSDDLHERQVQPWRLTSRRGRWYLTGFDLDRQAERMFRLDRIEGTVATVGRPGGYTVPADHDPVAAIAANSRAGSGVTARVQVRQGAGHGLRRRAQLLDAHGADSSPGWDLLEVTGRSWREVAADLAGLGPDARPVAPEELRSAWNEHLQRVLSVHADGEKA